MGNVPLLFAVLARMAYFALFGFLALVLFGPALAVVTVLAVFAVLGLIFGLPLRLLGIGRPLEWEPVSGVSRKCWGTVRTGCRHVQGAFHYRPVHPIGRLAYFALVGFVALMLFGPLVAVVSILAIFTVLGLIFWLPLRLVGFGRPGQWQRVRDAGQRGWETVSEGSPRVRGVWEENASYLERARAAGRFMGRVCRETLCGALVGGMVGLIPTLYSSFDIRPVLLGLGIGFVAGGLVALSSRRVLGETA